MTSATAPINLNANVLSLSVGDSLNVDGSGNLQANYTAGTNIIIDASNVISTTSQIDVNIGDFYLRNSFTPGNYAKFTEPFSQFSGANSIEIPDATGVMALTSNIDSAITSLAPIGSIIMYGNTTPPTGYKVCDGEILDNTTYPALFAIIGYTYGGSGSSFSIPDTGGLFIRGWDQSAGGYDPDAPRDIGTIQTDALQSHLHTVDIYDKTISYTIGSEPLDLRADTGVTITNTSAPTTGKTNADETRPVNICLPYIIRCI